jgi:hypothetical protein
LEEMSQQHAGHKYDARYRDQKPHVLQHRSSDVWLSVTPLTAGGC